MSLLLTPETGQACDDLHRARTEYLSVLSCSEVVSMVIDSGRLAITLKGGNTVSQELAAWAMNHSKRAPASRTTARSKSLNTAERSHPTQALHYHKFEESLRQSLKDTVVERSGW